MTCIRIPAFKFPDWVCLAVASSPHVTRMAGLSASFHLRSAAERPPAVNAIALHRLALRAADAALAPNAPVQRETVLQGIGPHAPASNALV
jgi:hypothetical protein